MEASAFVPCNAIDCRGIPDHNNLAALLIACHTGGCENLFAELPDPPKPKEVRKDMHPMFGADKAPGRKTN